MGKNGLGERMRMINRKNYKRFKMLPLKLVVLYLVFTVVLYMAGPFAWKTYEPAIFYMLLLLYLVFLIIGYICGAGSKQCTELTWTDFKEKTLIKMLAPLTILNCVVIFINLLRNYGFATFEVVSLLKNMITNILHMGEGYNQIQEMIASNISGDVLLGGRIMSLINYVWDFIGFNILLLDIYYFRKLKRIAKVFALISITETVLFFLSIGTNIGVFRVILAIVIFKVDQIMNGGNNKSFSRAGKRKMFYFTAMAGIVVVVYFVITMKSRGGILNWDQSFYNVGGISLNRDSIFFKILPEALYIPLISISSYLTQGYYGMSLCMRVGWRPMFGLGSSMGLVNLVTEYIQDINSLTYQFRIQEEFGWDSRVQWASMYTWFANDVGFMGVVIVMFLVGYLLALVFRDSLTTDNPFAKILMVYLALMCIFIPCNNQVLQSTYTLFSFITALAAWIVTSRVKVLIRG